MDKDKAKEMAGEIWPGTPRFDEAKSAEGTISAEQAKEYKLDVATTWYAVVWGGHRLRAIEAVRDLLRRQVGTPGVDPVKAQEHCGGNGRQQRAS